MHIVFFCNPDLPNIHRSALTMVISNMQFQMSTLLWVTGLALLANMANSFQCSWRNNDRTAVNTLSLHQTQGDANAIISSPEISKAASKFKVVTCMSTSCSKKRKTLGLDSLATFGALYSRSKGDGDEPFIAVEEGPCMGACKTAPCVAVEHDNFVGSVSLEGMTDREFADRV